MAKLLWETFKGGHRGEQVGAVNGSSQTMTVLKPVTCDHHLISFLKGCSSKILPTKNRLRCNHCPRIFFFLIMYVESFPFYRQNS